MGTLFLDFSSLQTEPDEREVASVALSWAAKRASRFRARLYKEDCSDQEWARICAVLGDLSTSGGDPIDLEGDLSPGLLAQLLTLEAPVRTDGGDWFPLYALTLLAGERALARVLSYGRDVLFELDDHEALELRQVLQDAGGVSGVLGVWDGSVGL